MAKTRLTADKRATLHKLAAEVVRDTPIDPAMEKRVANARVLYDKQFDLLHTLANEAISKRVTPAEMAVLAKYNLTQTVSSVHLVHLDTAEYFGALCFNIRAYDRKTLPAGKSDSLQLCWDDRKKYERTRDIEINKHYFKVPMGNQNLECNKKTLESYRAYSTAKEELIEAESADINRRTVIMRDFAALIDSARTFEDVVEVWPEAMKVTDLVCATGTAVSLMSKDAVARIKENMAIRNVS